METTEIDEALSGLPGWVHRDGALERTFTFDDFPAALAFIVRVGIEAEKRDHHPDLHNVYSRVTLRLSSHDAGGRVTARDLDLARAIQAFAA